MLYRSCGNSGIKLPVLSFGLWHNFGLDDNASEARSMLLTAFDEGICHFDLANNYGPPPGSAEEMFGKVMKTDLHSHRDEMFIASKAGHDMWKGVYGTGCSRKNLIASCNQSLKRTGIDYFDVFYSHRYDPQTPIEETMQALIDIVRSGKALYAGISKYPADKQAEAYRILREAHVPCLLSQYRCSMFDLKAKTENFGCAAENGSGIVCFSPLAQGLLAGKYNEGIPQDSRAARESGFLKEEQVTSERVAAARKLGEMATKRGQTLAQMSLAWVLNDERVSSVIIGASTVNQLKSNIKTIENLDFTEENLAEIGEIIKSPTLSFS